LSLDAIQMELEQCSPAELRALALEQDDIGSTTAKLQTRRRLVDTGLAQTSAPMHATGERWQRWILAPGLELHVSEQANAETRRQAEEVLSQFTGRRPRGLTS
jgi:Ca-activated chloride channel family protein